MAKEEFDFKALKESKFEAYKKTYCKPAALKKAKGGLVFIKFDLTGRKKGCVFLPFPKKDGAKSAYEKVKKDKSIHLLKHTALVEPTYGKADDGSPQMTLNILKGGLTADLIKAEGDELFNKTFKIQLKVTGASDDSGDVKGNENSDDTKEPTKEEKKEEPKVDEPKDKTDQTSQILAKKKARRGEAIKKMQDGVSKMDSVKETASVDKMLAKVAQFEDALEKLINEAQSDGVIDQDEEKTINTFKNNLDQLKKAIEERENAPKALTPERRKKMNENMDKMSARLEAMLSKLGI